MKSRWIAKILAMLAALALCLPVGVAEELGEVDLYDPAIYEGEAPTDPAPEQPAPEAPAETVPEAPAEPAPEAAPETAPETAEAAPEVEPEATPEAVEATPEVAEATPEAVEATPEAVEAAPEVEPEATLEPLLADLDAEVAPAQLAADVRMGLGEQFPLDGAALLNGAAPAAYASDHPEIASVDAATGVVTGCALGVAVITVTCPGASASLTVAVLNAPGELAFPSATLELGKGESRPFAASVPANAGAARITYASSKPKAVEVDAQGRVTARRTGTYTVTATAYNGAQAVCTLRVLRAPSKLKFPCKEAVLSLGETRALPLTLPKKSAGAVTWSSDQPGIVSVDAAGNLTGVAPGTATVTARAYNNKRATCKITVLGGTAPTALTLNATSLSLGKKEKFQLAPAVGEGEAAVYAYATSARRIATVSSAGLITAKKAGTATITVTTHNGVTAQVTVSVGSAPKKVAVSPSSLALAVGQTGQLALDMPAGSVSRAILWESSDPSVASVDGSGAVTALKGGTAVIRATTFNRKSALCKVLVTDVAGANIDLPGSDASAETAVSAGRMAANLRASRALGGKRDAIASVVELLVKSGFEPAFAAGVGANVYSEGTYGMFESSKYVSNYKSRPKYFCYLDGGNHYALKNGEYVVDAVYLSQEEYDAYEGEAQKMLRFGEENFYLKNYSGKYVQNVDLNQLEALMDQLAEGKWQGKFGLGIVQWTGARTKVLVSFYRRYAGSGDRITAAQVVAAENEMILYDFRGTYKGVYNAWIGANAGALGTEDAARSAGSVVCLRYEIPVNKEEKAVTRGNKAAEIYRIMMGLAS